MTCISTKTTQILTITDHNLIIILNMTGRNIAIELLDLDDLYRPNFSLAINLLYFVRILYFGKNLITVLWPAARQARNTSPTNALIWWTFNTFHTLPQAVTSLFNARIRRFFHPAWNFSKVKLNTTLSFVRLNS